MLHSCFCYPSRTSRCMTPRQHLHGLLRNALQEEIVLIKLYCMSCQVTPSLSTKAWQAWPCRQVACPGCIPLSSLGQALIHWNTNTLMFISLYVMQQDIMRSLFHLVNNKYIVCVSVYHVLTGKQLKIKQHFRPSITDAVQQGEFHCLPAEAFISDTLITSSCISMFLQLDNIYSPETNWDLQQCPALLMVYAMSTVGYKVQLAYIQRTVKVNGFCRQN